MQFRKNIIQCKNRQEKVAIFFPLNDKKWSLTHLEVTATGRHEICWNVCTRRPTLVLERPGWLRTFMDVLILISNGNGNATAATFLHLDSPSTSSPYIHTHTPLLDSAEAVVGMLLTMAGITLCVISSVGDAGPRDVTHWQIITTKDSNPFKWFLGRSRNRPKRRWSATKEWILDSVGGSLKSNGTWWENYADSVWCREKGWSWNFKRQVKKEVGSGGVHVKAAWDLWPS